MSRFTFIGALALSLSFTVGTATQASACGIKLVTRVKSGPKRQVRTMAERRPVDTSDSSEGRRAVAAKNERVPIAQGPAENERATVAKADPPKPEPRSAPPTQAAVATVSEPKDETPAPRSERPKSVRARTKPKAEVAAVEPVTQRDPLEVELHFDLGASGTSDSLSEVIDWVSSQPGGRLVVEGYADPSGSAGFNQRLSVRRARLVKKQIVDQTGISASKIRIRGFGETHLAYPADDSRNRRVVVRGK